MQNPSSIVAAKTKDLLISNLITNSGKTIMKTRRYWPNTENLQKITLIVISAILFFIYFYFFFFMIQHLPNISKRLLKSGLLGFFTEPLFPKTILSLNVV